MTLALVLFLWTAYSIMFPPQGPPQNSHVEQINKSPDTSNEVAPEILIEETETSPALPPISQSVTVTESREITVENNFWLAVFTSDGGTLVSFELKDYKEEQSVDSSSVHLISAETLNEPALQLRGVDGFDISVDLPMQANFSGDLLTVSQGETAELIFSSVTPSGLHLEKVYRFIGDRYPFELTTRLTNLDTSIVRRGHLDFSMGTYWDPDQGGGQFEFVGPVTWLDSDLQTDDVSDLEEQMITYPSQAMWSGFTNKYFVSSVIPVNTPFNQLQLSVDQQIVHNTFVGKEMTLSPGATATQSYLLYYGPRDVDILKSVGHQLDQVIDFGFFHLLAGPLLHTLRLFHDFFGNYGVSIIVLTVIIKLLFWPLTQKSYVSMKAVQKLQPEMQKLRERFKNDRDRMNREIMELYKKHRVNPLGGCLPMLIQIPVFFALYQVLLNSIELRHAPFVFWLTDLSAKDPYYVTPLIMGATMFIQQKMTPTTMDPAQAKIFMMMPIVFTFLFLNFPSGLVIYWLINNLLTILQQYLINRPSAAS
ncbi:MAG: protein translocase component YidC [Desulfuromonas sp.]|nr:MAG: protein translocase component YidC [Desulfuromonas sp.]